MRTFVALLAVTASAFACRAEFNAKTDPTLYIDFANDYCDMNRNNSYSADNLNPDPFVYSNSESMGVTIQIKFEGGTELLSETLRFNSGASFTVVAPQGYVVSNLRLFSANVGRFVLQGDNGEFAQGDNIGIGYGANAQSEKGGEWIGLAPEVQFKITGAIYGQLKGMFITCTPDVRTETSISAIDSGDSKSAEWYDLQGRKVENPGHGFYICRTAKGAKIVTL